MQMKDIYIEPPLLTIPIFYKNVQNDLFFVLFSIIFNL